MKCQEKTNQMKELRVKQVHDCFINSYKEATVNTSFALNCTITEPPLNIDGLCRRSMTKRKSKIKEIQTKIEGHNIKLWPHICNRPCMQTYWL